MSKTRMPVFDRFPTLQARAYRKLASDLELEDAAIELDTRRWEAIEWARERGIVLLRDLREEN